MGLNLCFGFCKYADGGGIWKLIVNQIDKSQNRRFSRPNSFAKAKTANRTNDVVKFCAVNMPIECLNFVNIEKVGLNYYCTQSQSVLGRSANY